jgi:hypothetical protein
VIVAPELGVVELLPLKFSVVPVGDSAGGEKLAVGGEPVTATLCVLLSVLPELSTTVRVTR